MGVKSFFKKVWGGIKKAGRFVKDKVLPAVGRIAKPVLSVVGALPGKIGMIGRIGSGIADILRGATEKIPNEDARRKLDDIISRGHDKFQTVVDRGRDIANGVNRTVDVGRDMINRFKQLPVDVASKVGPK